MKKIAIFLILILVLGFFVNKKIIAQNEVLEPLPPRPLTPIKSTQGSSNTTSDVSSSSKGPFGGWIINKKATKIQSLENAGYTCPVLGQTIEIKNARGSKGPTSYFIPSFIRSTYPTGIGKAILGYFAGKTTIVCTHPSGAVENVILSNIINYGVSKSPVLKK